MNIMVLMYGCPSDLRSATISGEVKNTVNLAVKLSEVGHDVTIVSAARITDEIEDGGTEIELSQGVKLIKTPAGFGRGIVRYFSRAFAMTPYIRKELTLNRFDVVHCHATPFLMSAYKAVRQVNYQPKVFLSAHGTYFPELKADIHSGGLKSYLRLANGNLCRLLDSALMRRCDKVVSMSYFQTRELYETYGLSESHVSVIHNGVDFTKYYAQSALSTAWKLKAGLQDKKVILYVGRFTYKKGMHLILKAIPDVLAQQPDVHFVFVGGQVEKSSYYRDLKNSKEYQAAADSISFYEFVDETILPAIYSSAQLTLVPSIGYESIPTVVLEATACGSYVLATGSWGIPEVLKSDDHFILEGNSDDLVRKIISYLENTKNIVSDISKFDLNRIAQENLKLYGYERKSS